MPFRTDVATTHQGITKSAPLISSAIYRRQTSVKPAYKGWGRLKAGSLHARRSRYLAGPVSVVIRRNVSGEGYRLPLFANTEPISPTKTDSACVGQSPPLLNCVQTSREVAFCGLICLSSAPFASYEPRGASNIHRPWGSKRRRIQECGALE